MYVKINKKLKPKNNLNNNPSKKIKYNNKRLNRMMKQPFYKIDMIKYIKYACN